MINMNVMLIIIPKYFKIISYVINVTESAISARYNLGVKPLKNIFHPNLSFKSVATPTIDRLLFSKASALCILVLITSKGYIGTQLTAPD